MIDNDEITQEVTKILDSASIDANGNILIPCNCRCQKTKDGCTHYDNGYCHYTIHRYPRSLLKCGCACDETTSNCSHYVFMNIDNEKGVCYYVDKK